MHCLHIFGAQKISEFLIVGDIPRRQRKKATAKRSHDGKSTNDEDVFTYAILLVKEEPQNKNQENDRSHQEERRFRSQRYSEGNRREQEVLLRSCNRKCYDAIQRNTRV